MRKLMIISGLLFWAVTAPAAILLQDFSAFSGSAPTFSGSWSFGGVDQYSQSPGFISVAPVTGGANPQDDGDFIVSDSVWDFTGLNTASISAKIDPGNEAGGFQITFYDLNFNSASAAFDASSFGGSFSTVNKPISFDIGFDLTNVVAWQLSGGAFAASDDFRLSFNQIDILAVPEPGTFLLILPGLAFCLFGRQRPAHQAAVI